MKYVMTGFLGVCGLACACQAGLLVSGSPNEVIPDGNAAGYRVSTTVTEQAGRIDYVRVHLDLQGGWNGDLYAQLSYTPPGGKEATACAVLLNRIGRETGAPYGSSTAGLNVWLSDTGTDIHRAGSGPLEGSFAADGRTASPLTVTGDSPRNGTLVSFQGVEANGQWDLFFADVSGGSESRLRSWDLELGLSVVPEPVGLGLGVFGGLLGLGTVLGRMWKR